MLKRIPHSMPFLRMKKAIVPAPPELQLSQCGIAAIATRLLLRRYENIVQIRCLLEGVGVEEMLEGLVAAAVARLQAPASFL